MDVFFLRFGLSSCDSCDVPNTPRQGPIPVSIEPVSFAPTWGDVPFAPGFAGPPWGEWAWNPLGCTNYLQDRCEESLSAGDGEVP